MKLLNQIVDGVTRLVMGISAGAVLVVTFAQVVCRYALKSPLPWSQDVLRLAFTYLVFWGAAWCVRERGHLNVDVVLTAIPARLRQGVELAINVVLCAFFLFLVLYGIRFAQNGLTQTAPYLPIPMTLYYASIPSASALMLFYMLGIAAQQILAWFKKEDEA